MKIRLTAAALLLCLLLGVSGCARDTQPPDGESIPEPVEETTDKSGPGEPTVSHHPLVERYYDYIAANSHICMLLTDRATGAPFTDDEMAAYAIGELLRLEVYDYETGHTREEFDAITEKYFGRRIENFENTKSTVLPSGNVTSTGWGMGGIYMVLADLQEAGDGRSTGRFYTIGTGMGEGLPAPDILKAELLSGHMGDYGQVILVEVEFQELYDADGGLYLRYHALDRLGDAQEPYLPYTGA